MSEWYYAHGGAQKGPVPVSELQQLAASGDFDPATDLVWREGMEDWKPAGTVDELAGAFQSAPEATPAPVADTATPAAVPAHEPPVPAGGVPVPAPAPATPAASAGPATSGQAIASMVCGLVGFFTCLLWCLALPLSIVGIVMGHLASSKIRARPEQFKGLGLARTGLISGYLGLLAAIAVVGFSIWMQTLTPEEIQELEWLPPEARESFRDQKELR